MKTGNHTQQLAFRELSELKIFEMLNNYNPLLAGTIPIDIDIPGSDLDVVCQCMDHEKFKKDLNFYFGSHVGFEIYSKTRKGLITTVARFKGSHFPIEIFGQDIQTEDQAAFRHMLIEHKIILEKGEVFRNQIRELKLQGCKTEPAFAKLLGLKGDPYDVLLKF